LFLLPSKVIWVRILALVVVRPQYLIVQVVLIETPSFIILDENRGLI
jgi:hypothetical protein